MQFSEGMVWGVGSVKSWHVCKIYIVYTSTFWNCLCKNGCVAVETRVHTSPKSLAFKIVTQIIICITTKMQGRVSGSCIRLDVNHPLLQVRRRHIGVEWGRGGRRCFNSKGDPLTGITSNWLSPQSISSVSKRRRNSRGNSFGINVLSNMDTLAWNPPLTLPSWKSLMREQIGDLAFGKVSLEWTPR